MESRSSRTAASPSDGGAARRALSSAVRASAAAKRPTGWFRRPEGAVSPLFLSCPRRAAGTHARRGSRTVGGSRLTNLTAGRSRSQGCGAPGRSQLPVRVGAPSSRSRPARSKRPSRRSGRFGREDPGSTQGQHQLSRVGDAIAGTDRSAEIVGAVDSVAWARASSRPWARAPGRGEGAMALRCTAELFS